MPLDFLHGVEVVEIDDEIRPISTARFSVIGLCGTSGKGKINEPVLVTSRREAVAEFGPWLGEGFSIPEALDAIYDQAGAWVVVVNVNDHATNTASVVTEEITFSVLNKASVVKSFLSAISVGTTIKAPVTFALGASGTLSTPTGTTPTTIQSEDGQTTYVVTTDYTITDNVVTRVGAGGIADGETVLVTYTATAVAVDTDYTVNTDTGEFTRVTSGSVIMPKATVSVDYDWADPSIVTETAVIGGVNAGTGEYEGVHAFKSAANALGVTPRILIAPQWTHQKPDNVTANAVVAEMVGVADTLKGIIFADAPNTTDADAIQYRNDWGSKRIMVVDPFAKVKNPKGDNVGVPSSAHWAGVTSRTDQKLGFWWSPSNKLINGIIGTMRGVEFSLGDRNARANYLNSNEVSTIVRREGFRTWGNRTTSSDPLWAFLSVVRTADAINESILQAHLWAVDRAISKNLVEAIVEGVNAYLRHLTAQGAILGGKAWADAALNTPAVIQSGELYIDFEFTAPYPAEKITFRSHLVNDYVTEIFDQVSQAA